MWTLPSRRAVLVPWLFLTAVLAVACAGKPKATDTGYEGTWTLGNDRIRSNLSIVRSGGSYVTRLAVHTSDGTYAIRTGWDGRGDEVQNGARMYDLVRKTSFDAATGRLLVECTGTPLVPSRKPFHYREELVVESGGLVLAAYTLERDGQQYKREARPRREYVKASDEVRDPPAGGGAR